MNTEKFSFCVGAVVATCLHKGKNVDAMELILSYKAIKRKNSWSFCNNLTIDDHGKIILFNFVICASPKFHSS